MEPILSTSGNLDPPPNYLKRLVEECKKRNMLVIMDEAQTGIGRAGQMFAFERDGIVRDILCLSKTLGCGLPFASVSTTAEFEKGCREAKFLWLPTHLKDLLTVAVGNKVLEIVERDNVCQHAQERDTETKAPGLEIGHAVADRAMSRGLSCNVVNFPGMGGIFRVAHPVTVSASEIKEGLRILDEAFEYVLESHGSTRKVNGVEVPAVD
ncbi:hypothetical protein SLS61_004898 [Didymella pomorum]